MCLSLQYRVFTWSVCGNGSYHNHGTLEGSGYLGLSEPLCTPANKIYCIHKHTQANITNIYINIKFQRIPFMHAFDIIHMFVFFKHKI